MDDPTFPVSHLDYTMYHTEEETEIITSDIFCVIQIFNIIVYSLIFILGIIGNVLVIWIAGFKMKKTINVIWFLNLAIADFAFDLSITECITEGHWPFGQTMCKVIFTVLFLNMSVTISFLMIISVDQCITISRPVWSQNHRSTRLAITISIIVWFICFMLISPYLVSIDIVHDDDNISYCMPIYPMDNDADILRYNIVVILRFVFMFLIPFLIITTCYSLVVLRLRRSRSLLWSSRPLKLIIIIVLCFFGFWFPLNIWSFLEVLNVDMNSTVHFIMSNLVYHIGFMNGCVKPIIYVFVGRDFKKNLFRSIYYLLENTFKEMDDSEPDDPDSIRL
ncbi:chemerin-like receptor 1 [Leptodactylus fuscus]|uniref:chemerin-like receptor 1 n=1 Tax=Leptodactylus fuscus TaxID=238119 RepID=UPI003F4EC70E